MDHRRGCGLYRQAGTDVRLVAVRPGPEDYLLDVLLYPGLWLSRPSEIGLAWVRERPDAGGDGGPLGSWERLEWIIPPGSDRLPDWLARQWSAAGLGPLPPADTLNGVPLFLWLGLLPSRAVLERLQIASQRRLTKLLREAAIPEPVPVGEADEGQRPAMRLWWLGDVLRAEATIEPEEPVSRWFSRATLKAVLDVLGQGRRHVTVEEAAHLIGRSVFSIWRWIRQGRLRAERNEEGRMLVDLESLAHYVRERLDPDEGRR